MTKAQKEEFCFFAAALLAPPDRDLLVDLSQDELRTAITGFVGQWGCDPGLLSVFFDDRPVTSALPELNTEYERLFLAAEGQKVSLVESTYKPWTTDKDCGMVFSGSKGLTMGDSAMHMKELYSRLSLEVPEEFRAMPDHLVMELEFLALLFRVADDEQIERFIGDHMDWITDLKEEMGRAEAHPFYRSAVKLIDLFLHRGSKDWRLGHHG